MCKKKTLSLNYEKLYDDIYYYLQFNSCTNVENLIDIIQTFKLINTEEKVIRVRTGNDWINHEILLKMRERNKLYRKWKRDESNVLNKLNYLKCKKKIDKMCIRAKQNQLNYRIEQAGSNTKKLWGIINNILTLNYSKNDQQVNKIKKMV